MILVNVLTNNYKRTRQLSSPSKKKQLNLFHDLQTISLHWDLKISNPALKSYLVV